MAQGVKWLTKAEQWEFAAGQMNYMALLRNLRNMDQAGVSDEVAKQVIEVLTDPAQVERSRQFPYRFLSAYEEVGTLRWGQALETALNLSLKNIPRLDGGSLVLIDTSASMENHMSGKSRMTRVRAAAVFGLAQALKNPLETDVFGFADGQFQVTNAGPGISLLKAVEAFCRCIGKVGHGTQIELAVNQTFNVTKHKRVFLFTDMQTFPTRGSFYGRHTGNAANAVPKNVPVYGFNLAGYTHSAMPAGGDNRHEMGGLTDATFTMIKMLETGRNGVWPWQNLYTTIMLAETRVGLLLTASFPDHVSDEELAEAVSRGLAMSMPGAEVTNVKITYLYSPGGTDAQPEVVAEG